MGIRLLLYLGILILGGLVGYKELGGEKLNSKLSIIQTICLLFLLFIMGIRMGLDDKVVSSFFELGFQAVIISIFTITFSVICVLVVRKYIVKREEKEVQDSES